MVTSELPGAVITIYILHIFIEYCPHTTTSATAATAITAVKFKSF